jgi:hypothetical protein
MQAAIVTWWVGPKAGREQEALEVFGAFQEYWDKRIHEGKATRRDTYFEESGRGMAIVHGEHRDLVELMESDEYIDLSNRATLISEGREFRIMFTGDAIERILGAYVNAGRSLGFL